jgi:hypothetical protein
MVDIRIFSRLQVRVPISPKEATDHATEVIAKQPMFSARSVGDMSGSMGGYPDRQGSTSYSPHR